MEIIKIPLEQLTPDPHNAKDHPQWQIEQIKNSIEQFGNLDPIGVWGDDNLIVEGHGRYEALKELGYHEAECIRLDWLTEEERKAYALAHNKLTMNSGFIPDALDMTLAAIGEIDMSQFGFEIPEEEEPTEITEDEIPEKAETRCKLGDLWQLGEHRLICGDSTSADDVAALMDGAKGDLVVTDPPYGVSYNDKNEFLNKIDKGNHVQKAIENDSRTPEDMYEFWKKCFQILIDNTKDKMAYYIFGPQGGDLLMLMRAIVDSGFMLKHNLVWVKNNHVLGRCDYSYKHEPICYGWKPNGTHSFYADFDTSVFEDELDVDKMKKDELLSLVKQLLSDKVPVDVIHENKLTVSGLHPTMKPVKLIARLISNSTRAGEIVVDTFGGSGTTLIACEQLKRKCYMCELDEHYCDVIIQRWENLTGGKAVRINDAG